MTESTHIKSISCEPLNIKLTEPFGISGGAQAEAKNVLVKIVLNDGTLGIGEAAPYEPYNGETQSGAVTAINSVNDFLLGKNVQQWKKISKELKQLIKESGSARCGIEMALLDALTKSSSTSLWSFFGGKTSSIETDMTITSPTFTSEEDVVMHAEQSAKKILERGIKIIKTKVGSNLSLDIKRLEAISRHAPTSPLILDGNGGFSSSDALSLIEELKIRKINVIMFEQPVPGNDLIGLKEVTDKSGVLVAADESVKDIESAKKLIELKAAHVVNIKTMKSGIVEAIEVSKMCKEAGLKLMIGGNVETILSMTVSACLSYGLGIFDFHDLDTPAWMVTNPFQGGFVQQGAEIFVSHILSGHGVTI